MGRDRNDSEVDDCGSISPESGLKCNHKKGHKGKCIHIVKGKRGLNVIEYWEPTPLVQLMEKKNELGG